MHPADVALAPPIPSLDSCAFPAQQQRTATGRLPADPTGACCAPSEDDAATAAKGFPLMMADEATPVRIVAVRAGKGLALRLNDLGLNIGTALRVVQRQGGGLLVARGETRIALGAGMAAKILVAPVT